MTKCPGLGNIPEGICIDETNDGDIAEQSDVTDNRFGTVSKVMAVGYVFDRAEGTAVRTTESGGDKTETDAERFQK